jgi:hypothetical protein
MLLIFELISKMLRYSIAMVAKRVLSIEKEGDIL